MDDAQQHRTDTLPGFIVFAILILEGFVTISVQILTIRQMIPVVGNSVIVTSLVIGVFLLFLAIGYYLGGQHKTNYRHTLIRNFIIAGSFIGIGLSYKFIQSFFLSSHAMLNLPPLWTLTCYLLIIIAPAVYFLGQTVPITTNLFKPNPHVGSISGKVLFLSTIGSFLGAVLTSLALMNTIGVAATVCVNYLFLTLLITTLLSNYNQPSSYIPLILSMILIPAVYQFNIQFEQRYFISANAYSNYRISHMNQAPSNKKFTIFHINQTHASIISKDLEALPYMQEIRKILFKDLKLKNKNILVLGAGGFTLSAKSSHGNHITYNDIDKRILPLVKKHFLKNINGNFIPGDARHLISTTNKLYDIIISDAYSSHSIPYHLITRNHLINIKKALTASGIAIFNIIAKPTLDDPYSSRVNRTILSVFHNCMIMPQQYDSKPENILYVCKKSKWEQDTITYTDDLNKAALDYHSLYSSTQNNTHH